MAANAIHEMISAYAAGCMDKKNFKTFREYMSEGGDLPVGELGELQNVISLLPVILELEKPNPAIKDKVAKKLISLQDEIKEKIRITKQSTKTSAKTVVRSLEPEYEEELNLSTTNDETRQTSFDEVTPLSPISPPTRGTEFYESAKRVNPPPPTSVYELPPRTLKDIETDNSSGKIKALWIALGLSFLILLGTIIILQFSSKDYDSQFAALESRINSLQQEVQSTRDLVTRFDELIEFMNYKDIQIIQLSPVDNSTSGYGKLMLSFTHREGLLELSEMPTLGTDQAFQIWLISDGRSYSVGSYVPNRAQKYIPIKDIPYLPKNQVELVRVTIEPLTGSELPQGPAVLFGSVNAAATTPARR